jgi:hypothetical protein
MNENKINQEIHNMKFHNYFLHILVLMLHKNLSCHEVKLE